RARTEIADVIGKRVRLVRRGRDLLGLCPFHKEKTPSFTVFHDHYHCFGCGAHGSAIDFVMEVEGLGFREAVERLAAQAGLDMPVEEKEDAEQAARRKTLYDVLEAAAAYFERMVRMPEGAHALDYLHGRGLDDELIRRFRLGYAPAGSGALRAALARDGIFREAMVEAGLLVAPEDPARAPYDRFRGRVMFPICDRRGRVVAFGGRILDSGEPKYLNSPETPLFRKGHMLYAYHQAAKPARERGTIVVVEGYMDVIAMFAAGFENTVAPLGTALTVEQIAELWRLVPEPVLLFDPDEAGQRAAARAAERVLPIMKPGHGLRFAFVNTDTSDDPDGVSRRYPTMFIRQALSQSLSLSDMLFWIETGGKAVQSGEQRAALEDRLRRRTSVIDNATVRNHFLSDLKDRLWRSLRQSGGARSREGRRKQETALPTHLRSRSGVPQPIPETGDTIGELERRREAILLAVLISHPKAVDTIGERLGSLTYGDQELDSLRQEVLKTLASSPDLDSERLESHLRQSGFGDALDLELKSCVRQHAFFAQPDVGLETALEGWEETYSLHSRRHIRAELDEVAARLTNQMSERDFEYFRELKRLEQATTDGDIGAPSGDDSAVGRD
ncbi:MAG: DNA primase, partial [Rhodospirillales bacterium]|nr:DNA primase [Rhodospirillales bacterium]